MEKFLRKTACILCLALLFAACDQDDPPAPAPAVGLIESNLVNKYWKEEIHFLYQRRGANDAKIYMDTSDILDAYRVIGGYTYADQVLLDAIFIEKEGSVLRYVNDQVEYTGYYRYDYAIEYDEYDETVRILTPHDSLKYMGAVTGSEMKLVSLSSEMVVFDAPIKPFIWQNWQLGNPDLYMHNYVGIRVVWMRLDPNVFNWVDQLD